jgi:hypothetical protein
MFIEHPQQVGFVIRLVLIHNTDMAGGFAEVAVTTERDGFLASPLRPRIC